MNLLFAIALFSGLDLYFMKDSPNMLVRIVPEVMANPQLAGIGMAVLALGQNLGMFIGPALFGRLIDTMSWTTAGYLLIPVFMVGIGAGWLVKVR